MGLYIKILDAFDAAADGLVQLCSEFSSTYAGLGLDEELDENFKCRGMTPVQRRYVESMRNPPSKYNECDL